MKVFVVMVNKGITQSVDSVYRFKTNANTRKYELLNEGDAQSVKIVEKELE
jgi:hypothetical protein